MTDLHEMRLRAGKNLQDVFVRLAEVEADLKSVLDREAATTARYDARLAEVERERDEARARVAKAEREWAGWQNECARFAEERDEARARVAAVLEEAESICDEERHNLAALTSLPPQSAGVVAARNRIRAIARPEETDALERIRAEERERCAKKIETIPNGAHVSDYAAAIREDKT